MQVGIPQETAPGERRVTCVPAQVSALKALGCEVLVETNAGRNAGIRDGAFVEQGASIVPDKEALFSQCDLLFQIHPHHEAGLYRKGQIIIGQVDLYREKERLLQIAKQGATVFSLDLLPRISRAQSMDILSSMSTIAGYKAVILAADHLNKIFPMMITAAGTLAPVRMFVIGAGVAGLSAIATGNRLGARVQGYDVRPATKEQVESLGATFLEIPLESDDAEEKSGYAKEMDEQFYKRQQEMMTQAIEKSDVVVTTALIPGKKAPVLITEEMVKKMPAGSTLVDLAASGGGNCALTKPGEIVQVNGVTIIGYTDLPSRVPFHSSQMYARNLYTFLKNMVKEGKVEIDRNDPIISDTLLVYEGELVHPALKGE